MKSLVTHLSSILTLVFSSRLAQCHRIHWGLLCVHSGVYLIGKFSASVNAAPKIKCFCFSSLQQFPPNRHYIYSCHNAKMIRRDKFSAFEWFNHYGADTIVVLLRICFLPFVWSRKEKTVINLYTFVQTYTRSRHDVLLFQRCKFSSVFDCEFFQFGADNFWFRLPLTKYFWCYLLQNTNLVYLVWYKHQRPFCHLRKLIS